MMELICIALVRFRIGFTKCLDHRNGYFRFIKCVMERKCATLYETSGPGRLGVNLEER